MEDGVMTVAVSGESEADRDGHFGCKVCCPKFRWEFDKTMNKGLD